MKRMMLFGLLALAACSGDSGPDWRQVPVGDLEPKDVVRFESARAGAKTLGMALMGELLVAMEKGGPIEAISACREVAPKLTADLSSEPGVRAGRTSHRLRNGRNRPPSWLADLEAAEPRIYLGPNDEMGVTLPITAKQMCLTCHGSEETMEPALLEKIGSLYPKDQATGFADGDLRGQFWVELK